MNRVICAAVLALAATIAVAAYATPSVTPQSGLAPAASGEPPEDLVQPDPHVVLGRLPNGMRYAIARTAGPPETTINLYIGAGSANETDAERGTAHFLEHMAFSGSKSFPGGSVLPRFEEIGVALGRDQNAQTGFAGTTFSLDLPSSTEAKIDLAFLWLRDVADGLTIDPAEVDRERGTILSEYRESLNPNTAILKKSGEFMLPELLGSRREPIGTLETIRSATAASIRAFYEKWYRPEDAILVVVSEEPVEQILARIEQSFGSWRDATPPQVKPDRGRVNADRGLDVTALSNPNVANELRVCRARTKDPVQQEGVMVHLRDLEDDAWTMVLRRRLVLLSETANPPIAAVGVDHSDIYDTAGMVCVFLGVRNQDWRSAVKVAAEETRRLELYGVTPAEMKATVAALQTGLDAGLAGGNKMTQKSRADLMLGNFLLGGTIDSVEEDYRVVNKALARVTADRVDDDFHRVWSDADGPLVMLISTTPVASDAVRKAWLDVETAKPPAKPVDEVRHAWAYTAFGPPGVVAHRTRLDDIDASRIEFANGVRVNFKSLSNMQDKVFVRIRFGAGQQELTPSQGFAAQMGALMLRAGGLGKNDFQDTVQLCQTHSCTLDFGVGRDSFIMQGATRVADLDVQLQLLTAFLTDPAFRPEIDAQLPTATAFAYRQIRGDPDAVASRALRRALPPPRIADMPAPEEAAKIRSADFARVLGPALKTDALEVTVVGDVDEDTAVAALAKTLGAIPARARRDRTLPGAARIRFPDPAPPPIHVTHDGPADKASVLMTWPLFVWEPGRLREQRTIEMLGAILQDELIQTVRRKLGKTYSPAVRVDLARGGDQGDLNVQLITAPKDAQTVIDETRKIVGQYADGNITPDALERVQRPLLDGGQSRELTVGWWMDTLDGSWAHPDKLAASQSWQADYGGITLDEIKAEARKWLARTPIIVVATPKSP